MKFDYILQLFSPKDKKFFPLFEKASANLLDVSKILIKALKTKDIGERDAYIKEIEQLEHKGDQITHDIFHELSSSFITPFDREDIHNLAAVVDDILDFIHGSAKRIQLYHLKQPSKAMVDLAELILQGNEQLHHGIMAPKDLKNIEKVKEICVKINSIENLADDVFDTAVAKLFDEEKDAIELIRVKEILQNLETATDKCEDAANVIESIIVKYS
jgi:predicted phosphate transport protein (TIGR00153 family)